tara:strand:+ start:175 stop:381 length:207 start_codon:yes stop_codon:yes gene_type:complete
MKSKVYWLEAWQGETRGGIFFRSDLFKHIKTVEEAGMKVVGLAIDDSWNIEIIIEWNIEPIIEAVEKN